MAVEPDVVELLAEATPKRAVTSVRIVDSTFEGGFRLGLGFIAAVWVVNAAIGALLMLAWGAFVLLVLALGNAGGH